MGEASQKQFAENAMRWAEKQHGIEGAWATLDYNSSAYLYPKRVSATDATVLKVTTFSPNGNVRMSDHYVVIADKGVVGCTCLRTFPKCAHMSAVAEYNSPTRGLDEQD